ncbi:MAG: Crp/Fnr family transcriptional regulator [Marinilabiliales bacterium]|nr:MAG: Crp/Fnr family transcriptional regulator [Marinilabiliales bacterium]
MKSIKACNLFESFSEVELEVIFEKYITRHKVFARDAVMAETGSRLKSLMLISRGSVRGEMIDASGKAVKIEDIDAPGTVGSAFIFGNGILPVNVVANMETEVMYIEKSSLLELMQNELRFLIAFLDLISLRSQNLSQKIKFLTFKTIKGKFAQYILQLAGETNKTIYLQKSQQEIADLFGVTRPSLARAVGEMSNEGIILVKRRAITITDRGALIDLLS